ncbi:MAG: hypothetical protein V3U87_08530 [Methylococcaceae bacterium]
MNNKKPNLSKIEKYIAGKFLKHDSKDFENFDQDLIIDSLGKHMDQIQKTKRWVLANVLILIWSFFDKSEYVKLFSFDTPKENIIYFAHAFFFFANVSLIIWFIRIGKLVLLLEDRENFIKGLSKLSTHTLIFNPFAFLGSKNYSKIWVKINICVLAILMCFLCILADFTGGEKPYLLLLSGIVMFLGLFIIKGILDIIYSRLDAKMNETN